MKTKKNKIIFKLIKSISRIAVLSLILIFKLQAQGFTGQLTTSEGDILKNAKVTAKQGTTERVSYSDENGFYTADFVKVGIADTQLPYEFKVGNSGSLNPILYLPENATFDLYNIRGQKVDPNSDLSNGIYVVRAIGPDGKTLGTTKLSKINSGKMNIEVRDITNHSFAKTNSIVENPDSVIVEYTNDDMLVQKLGVQVNVPEDGYETLDLQLERTRRNPTFTNISIPSDITIDTLYNIIAKAINPDYDAEITGISFEHIADPIDYITKGDTLQVIPSTRGQPTFKITAYDNQGGQTSQNINLNILTDRYTLKTLNLFDGLDLPKPNIDVIFQGDTIRTGEDGLAIFEKKYGELTKNVSLQYGVDPVTFESVPIITSSDSIILTDLVNGTLQDRTGYIVQMKFDINPVGIDNGGTYVLKHVLGDVTIDSEDSEPDANRVLEDPLIKNNPNYWDEFAPANLIHALKQLFGIHDFSTYVMGVRGTPEDGRMDLLHYSPSYQNPYFSGDSANYRWATQTVIDSFRTIIDKISKNEEGERATNPYTMINLSESPDSMLAIQKGNTFDFTTSWTNEKYFIQNDHYIVKTGQYVNNGLKDRTLLEYMMHELGRAVNLGNLSLYEEGKTKDIMRLGRFQLHDGYEFYVALNMWQKDFQKIDEPQNLLPN